MWIYRWNLLEEQVGGTTAVCRGDPRLSPALLRQVLLGKGRPVLRGGTQCSQASLLRPLRGAPPPAPPLPPPPPPPQPLGSWDKAGPLMACGLPAETLIRWCTGAARPGRQLAPRSLCVCDPWAFRLHFLSHRNICAKPLPVVQCHSLSLKVTSKSEAAVFTGLGALAHPIKDGN